jgi:hypothetical protein
MGFEADAAVVRLRDIAIEQARQLLGLFDLELVLVAENEAIPGSYWGE